MAILDDMDRAWQEAELTDGAYWLMGYAARLALEAALWHRYEVCDCTALYGLPIRKDGASFYGFELVLAGNPIKRPEREVCAELHDDCG